MLLQKDISELLTLIENRRNALLKEIARIEASLSHAPKGSLSVSSSNGYVSYYHKTLKNKKGDYLPKSNKDMIISLAQKEYDQKVLAQMKKQLSALNNCLRTCSSQDLQNIYLSFSPHKQKLITKHEETNNEFIHYWKGISYGGNPTSKTQDHYTKSGVHVRSKSESLIGDGLDYSNVPYRYEYPLIIDGNPWFPDFNCLNPRTLQEFYWDHFGIMDDFTYRENVLYKIKRYAANGYVAGVNMIYTFESMNHPLNNNQIKDVINQYLQ
ncbi:MAG: hypothetical protein MJ093_07655 [Saccharofermentans sp.]|nr:hypothetical protein [Saccharofermentans sp.]